MRLLFLLLFCFGLFPVSAQQWQRDFKQAQKISLAANKLMLVDFWAPWCNPCKRMDRESWSDPEVQKLLEDFVPVKVNIETDLSTTKTYKVRSIPHIFIMDANGEVVFSANSYMPRSRVIEILKKYALSTQFMQRDAIGFFQHNNYVTGFRLAGKYLDFSLHLDEAIRNDFLNLARIYLDKGGDLLDKEQDNYLSMQHKLELMTAIGDLYQQDFRRVRRSLENMDFEKLDAGNQVLYAYLSLGLSLDEQSPHQTQRWRSYLEEHNEAYLKRFDLLAAQVAREK